jgi:hypothetical protein
VYCGTNRLILLFVAPTDRHNLEHDSIACVREEVPMSVRAEDDHDTNSRQLHARPLEFRTLSGTETLHEQGIHLIRVPTIEPIFHRRWFIEQIETLLRNKSMIPTTIDAAT